MSMQELVWTESLAATAGPIDIQLPKPYAKRGYFRDAFVLAYPALAGRACAHGGQGRKDHDKRSRSG